MRNVFFLFLFVLLAFPALAEAAVPDVIDSSIYAEVLEKTKVSEADIKLYKDIFAEVDKGNFSKVDELVKKLKSQALMGHVLAEKYLHKNYTSSYKELLEWLKKYTDLPQYSTIKSLSVVKASGYRKMGVAPQPKRIYASYSWYNDKYEQLTPENRKYVKDKTLEFLKAFRSSRKDDAAKILQDKKLRKVIPDKNYDAMSATLSAAYFLEGDNKNAIKWSKKAVRRSKDATASWFGGLASWREKDYKTAAKDFETLAGLNDDEGLMSSGAYWAYRANLKLNNKEKAEKYLRIAAEYKTTFYGILAKKTLDEELDFGWNKKPDIGLKDAKYVEEINKSPIILRAILLLNVGQTELAEADLKRNFTKFSIAQRKILLYLSNQYSLANLSFVLSHNLKLNNPANEYNIFFYPQPNWEPKDGWTENQALIWALMRQESLFMPKIRSHAGACGLLQVMPATAAQMMQDNSLKKNWRPLLDKSNNMKIGQSYISYLRNTEYVGDNLIFITASYNGGHSGLQKWLNRYDYNDDPLLFIEMIPWKETRLYVKKVMANYWIYRSRMGEGSQSLQQLMDGEWPTLD